REDFGKPVAGSPAGGGGERGVIVLAQQAAAGIEEVHEKGVVGGRGSLDGALQRDETVPTEARRFDRPAGLGGSLQRPVDGRAVDDPQDGALLAGEALLIVDRELEVVGSRRELPR